MWAFLAGVLVGANVGLLVYAFCRSRAESDRMSYVILIEDTRTDDGARLLGEIEDAISGPSESGPLFL